MAKEQVVEGREAEGRDGMMGRRGRKGRRAAVVATRERSIGRLDGCVCAVCFYVVWTELSVWLMLVSRASNQKPRQQPKRQPSDSCA